MASAGCVVHATLTTILFYSLLYYRSHLTGQAFSQPPSVFIALEVVWCVLALTWVAWPFAVWNHADPPKFRHFIRPTLEGFVVLAAMLPYILMWAVVRFGHPG